jgi:virulence factor
MVGLGDIARKAYLPVLAATPGINLHLVTRDAAVGDELAARYRTASSSRDLDSVLGRGLDAAFVHAATDAHEELVAKLLRSGVHVYVDKPLAPRLDACERLVQLAEAEDRSLMVGFNRRFAPAYAELATRPRDIIVMAKNRRNLPGDPARVIFDDFIHVVDTLRALVPGPVLETKSDPKVVGGELHHVTLTLRGDGFVAFGIMNRMSGADEESLEVMGEGRKRRVENMAEVIDFDGPTGVTRRPDWTATTQVRGFDQICAHFLAAVRSGKRLCARDALATHALCEEIVRSVGPVG